MTETIIPCPDLDEALDFFTRRLGFRLDMIFPADAPQVAVVSGNGVAIRLEGPRRADENARPEPPRVPIISRADDAKWISGRAGMQYRDLIPGRLAGRLIGSHIKVPGGEVADYVHYHKVAFQMIYCWHGRVRVVYEDQGEPFWLYPGDCVLQPPEIRHRVLEAAAGTQVIELTAPADHETWVDHDMRLPTGRVFPDKVFGTQTFVHRMAAESTIVPEEFGGFESHHFGMTTATGGLANVSEARAAKDNAAFVSDGLNEKSIFLFLLTGRVEITAGAAHRMRFTPGDSILIPPHYRYSLTASANSEILRVDI